MGLLGCIFMMNTLLFCLVYWGLCIVVAPNDDAKIRRWECGLRMGTKKKFFALRVAALQFKNRVTKSQK